MVFWNTQAFFVRKTYAQLSKRVALLSKRLPKLKSFLVVACFVSSGRILPCRPARDQQENDEPNPKCRAASSWRQRPLNAKNGHLASGISYT